MKIERLALSKQFQQFVSDGNGVLIGAPGVGKTFLLKEYCSALLDEGAVCLYLPLDKLAANSEADLKTELGISTDLATFLLSQERPSVQHVVAVDAFDAARSEHAQQFVLRTLRRLKETLNEHWRIVVSVRAYDAKKSLALQSLFPPVPAHVAAEYPRR